MAECKRLESARQETVRGFKSHTLRSVPIGAPLDIPTVDRSRTLINRTVSVRATPMSSFGLCVSIPWGVPPHAPLLSSGPAPITPSIATAPMSTRRPWPRRATPFRETSSRRHRTRSGTASSHDSLVLAPPPAASHLCTNAPLQTLRRKDSQRISAARSCRSLRSRSERSRDAAMAHAQPGIPHRGRC